jgi:Flp pilus assembly protein TadB
MARTSSLRASDADRDKAIDRLRKACAEGRILAHELEDRIARALRAETYGDLHAVVADLPKDKPATQRRSRLIFRYPLLGAVVLAIGAVVVATLAALAFVFCGVFLVLSMLLRGGSRRRHHRHYRYRYVR